jgi:hypothetical protein
VESSMPKKATVEQTFGKEQSHADRPTDAVPSGQANQHTPTAILYGRLAHGPSPHRFAEVWISGT